MRRAAAALLLAACASRAPERPALVEGVYEPDSGTVLIRCGRLIDGLSDDARLGLDVYVVKGRIREVGERLEARFVNQIAITPGAFSAPGDSGSVIFHRDDTTFASAMKALLSFAAR